MVTLFLPTFKTNIVPVITSTVSAVVWIVSFLKIIPSVWYASYIAVFAKVRQISTNHMIFRFSLVHLARLTILHVRV